MPRTRSGRRSRAEIVGKAALTIGALVLAALFAVSCGKNRAQEITIAGSTSVHPFAELLAEQYLRAHPEVGIAVQGGGSTAGVQAVRDGAAAIGMCSRELAKQEEDLKSVVIAHDGIAVVVHPENGVSDLTLDQVRDIFSGKLTDWSALGGKAGKILPVTREEGSGTRGAFQEMVMYKDKIVTSAIVQNSSGSLRDTIAGARNGIGYVSLGLVDRTVKALKIGGIEANKENVKSKKYVLVRPFLFLTKGEPQGLAKAFIDYVLTPEAQSELEKEGLVSIR